MTARTSQGPLVDSRGFQLQQFRQSSCARFMHDRAHGQLDSFQIQTARLAPIVEDNAQQLLYFARDLLADRFGRFFSCGDRESSTGRARQILSFTSSSS